MPLIHELFDKKRHSRTSFDCGLHQLNNFLHKRISQDVKKGICRAFVFHDEGDIAAFYTISPAELRHAELGSPYQNTPGYLIGWLAVDKKYQGLGLGERVVMAAVERCYESSLNVGGQIAYVDAINEQVVAFYEKIGFKAATDNPNCLYFKLSDYKRSTAAK